MCLGSRFYPGRGWRINSVSGCVQSSWKDLFPCRRLLLSDFSWWINEWMSNPWFTDWHVVNSGFVCLFGCLCTGLSVDCSDCPVIIFLPVWLSVSLSAYLSAYLSVCLFCLSACISVSVCLPVNLLSPACIYVNLPVSLSVSVCLCLACLSICLSFCDICMSVFCLSILQPACLPVGPFV